MDDLISRRAALDAVTDELDMIDHVPQWVFNRLEKRLKQLPSAQPDLSGYSDRLWKNAYKRGKADAEIQKMQDMEQAEIQKAYELGKLDAMEEMPHWIPCSERMPKEKDAGILKKIGINRRSDYVLAAVEVKGERMTVTSRTQDGVWDWNMKYAFPEYKVVAWMPLPKPWEGRREKPDSERAERRK